MIKKDIYYCVRRSWGTEIFKDYNSALEYAENTLEKIKNDHTPDEWEDVIGSIEIFECKKIMDVVKTGTIKIPKTVEYIEVDDYELVGV